MADFRIAVGETTPAFQRTLKSDNVAVDLTGATVTFSLIKHGLAYILDAATTAVTPASGIVKYEWAAGDLTDTGYFTGTFKVVYTDASVEYFEYSIEVIDGAGIQAPVTPPAQDFATQAELDAHINDATAAHAGTAIANTPAGGIAATTVQAALNELDTDKAAAVHTHTLSAITDAGDSAGLDVGTTAGTVAAGDDSRFTDARTPTGSAGGVLGGTYPNPSFAADMATQAELDAHTGDATDAHPATAITNTPAGNIAATTVQAALNELDGEKVTKAGDTFTGTLAGTLAATTTDALTTAVTSDTNPRLVVNADGKLEWGPGNATQDVTLYRSAADTLKTDDALVVGGGSVSVGTNPAASGALRLPNNSAIKFRNAANTVDHQCFAFDSSNDSTIRGYSGRALYFQIDSTTVLQMGSTTLSFSDGINMPLGSTTGTKIGTTTTQKLGFWNATPVVQPTTAVTAAAFVANTSGIADDTATFGGYTIGQIVAALKSIGALA